MPRRGAAPERGRRDHGQDGHRRIRVSIPRRTRNPHNPAHTPGGSSSGSAAAVADFMAPRALGTQTGGSVLRPAAFCGVVGYKPTFDAINPAGVKPNSSSYDTVGVMARSVADAALGFSVLTNSSATLPVIDKPRIGFYRTPQWDKAEPATAAALEDAAARLGKAGARIREITMPEKLGELADARSKIGDFESSRALAWERRSFEDKISAKARERLKKGDAVHARRIPRRAEGARRVPAAPRDHVRRFRRAARAERAG